ncbi:hypothetical protein QIA34_07900 (plasmid) [Borreliella yangtzensis]|uniref:Vacuolar-type H+-ATPase subunit I/STV1 n=1 Tax=Borreliella yangtzensis TaxID=683292 RepID=A0ABR6PBJ5_9SPIR|nr:vacuolar-type H+-ATPase subunit I/STV1 [Borreliella yangtzensis]
MKKKFFIICAVFALIMSCDNHGNLKIIEEKNQEKTKEKDVKGQVQGFFEIEDKELMQADEPKKQISKEEQQKQNRKKALEDAKEKVEGFKKELEELEKRVKDKKQQNKDTDYPADDPMRIESEVCKCAFELGFNPDDLYNSYVVYKGERYIVYKGIETENQIITNLLQKIEEELIKF